MSIQDVDDVDDLKRELRRMDTNLTAAVTQIPELKERVAELEAAVERLESDVSVTKASVPEQSKGRIDNALAVLEFAYDKQTSNRPGVKVSSGEVTAAINQSKQTALRLMDDLGGKVEWAHTENPGGPNPKVLKIRTDAPLEDRKNELAEAYSR